MAAEYTVSLEKRKELWELFLQRPAMFLGRKSLELFWIAETNYKTALYWYGITPHADDPWVIPDGFHDYVGYRLGRIVSSFGWHGLLLDHTGSDEAAFDLFVRYIQDYRRREEKLVARLIGHKKTFRIGRPIERPVGRSTNPSFDPEVDIQWKDFDCPSSLRVITFGNDVSGFFVFPDEESDFTPSAYFHSIEAFEDYFEVSREKLTDVDPNWNFGLAADD